MKRCRRIVLSVCLLEMFCACAWAKYGGGSGTADDPYLISTVDHLLTMMAEKKDRGKYFRLVDDIDLAGCTSDQYQVIGVNWQGQFYGVFDGNGKTISNFTYTCADVNCVGLFGWVTDNARIENLGLIDPNISAPGCSYVGSLAGDCRGTVVNCYVTNATISGMNHVGGLFGTGGPLSGCHASGTVTGAHNVGGLAGYVWGSVTCCSATADVAGADTVGGLTGWNNARVGGCFSTGTVSGDTNIGGLVGVNSVTIANCYSTCNVSGYDQVGGLVGGASWRSTTANCYATGRVTGDLKTGGLVGLDCAQMAEIPDAISACFWDMQTSGRATSDGGTGLSTARMQTLATFLDAGWDFTEETANGANDLWQMPGRRAYPRLCWEQIPIEEPNDKEFGPPWTDDFEDGVAEPLWGVHESAGGLASVLEIEGRLQVQTTDYVSGAQAVYVSRGWMLDATEDFFLKIDFRFSQSAAGEGWLSLGLTPDANDPAAQYVEVAAGCLDGEPVYAARQATDTGGRRKWWASRQSETGTLYISYDAAKDELYQSSTGYGAENALHVTSGLLQGQWARRPLYIVIGGNSMGMALTGLDTWLDDFAVDSGMAVW